MNSRLGRTLQGKTLFVTGASRGIGLAIAIRAARDGANIVLVAKTTVPNPPPRNHTDSGAGGSPKLTKTAGFEWGTGFYINPTPPEEAAKFLREASVEEPVAASVG